MLIRTGFEIALDCPQDTPMILALSVHTDRERDVLTPDALRFEPAVPHTAYIDGFGNRCHKLVAPAGLMTIRWDGIVLDSGEVDRANPDAGQVPVERLPPDTHLFLLGSRYCETDKLGPLAWELFGGTEPGWRRVQAVVDYCHERLQFDYQRARATRSALEAHEERTGVCRDFAHLAVTFCRALNIPARYATGYLGDIGVPRDPAPMDFSAWFEVYLEGGWYTFDARHNRPRVGRIVMARGRDATDVAMVSSFGRHWLHTFRVWTDELPGNVVTLSHAAARPGRHALGGDVAGGDLAWATAGHPSAGLREAASFGQR